MVLPLESTMEDKPGMGAEHLPHEALAWSAAPAGTRVQVTGDSLCLHQGGNQKARRQEGGWGDGR